MPPKAAALRPLKALARRGLPAWEVALAGTYLAPRFPGDEARPRPGWAGSFLLVRGPRATWILSLVDRAEVVRAWREPLAAWVRKLSLVTQTSAGSGRRKR